ncbi:FecR family protein [Carboxylicivirga sp. M1479]|uniref:FecR family protein n=1 Tax=Carboxylicivirga sp. M1479 TaxID=2594476 RepID=UPI0011773EF7|nr:FecR domain-containing protein [Carboxylicivirga sp. M1479]TRX71234.1 DUF4974 domain-containing protein [Carboxylicivirga sp. M1479]
MQEIDKIISKLKQHQPLVESDYKVLLNYLQHDGNEAEFKKTLSSHWSQVCDDQDLVLHEPDDLFYKIYHQALESEKDSTPKVISLMGWVQRIAALLFLPLLILSAWNYYSSENIQELADEVLSIQSPIDSKTRFFLPDGTQGWLQANSSIQFAQIDNKERSVQLDGEAFFDVARNEKQPFIVSTNDFKVRVLGTRFNVMADANMAVSKVYLEEGSVEMLGINNEHHTLLKPGEEFLFDKKLKEFSVNTGLQEEHIAWTKGILLLKNKTLKESALALEKFYNIEIEIADKELENMPVYAKIQNEQIDEVLEYAKLILPITYSIEKPIVLKDGTFTKRKVVIRKVN